MKTARILCCLIGLVAGPVVAASAGPDLSGVYRCTGSDAKEGAYTATATLVRVPAHSVGADVAYTFALEVPGYGTYPGEAVANGTDMAIHFALVDQGTHDYGTGLARFHRTKEGKWAFHKFYFEPEFKGGNHGTEDCVIR